jgi:outer membrane protein
MLKKVLIFLLLNVSCVLYGQQLTRFAVVDLQRVYTTYFNESRAVREFEERSNRVQSEVDRRTREIQELRGKHAEAVLQDHQSEANSLELRIQRMTDALRDYYQTQTAILERQMAQLSQSSSFRSQVYDGIRRIAESEGYTMVMNKSDPNIIWFSSTIDITDKLIQNLRARN